MLETSFFNIDATLLARELLGKVICHKVGSHFRKARIIETEAYYKSEKGSHAHHGFTHKRRALFMPAGTIYMYHSQGGDSMNVSAEGEGNAVLIKAGIAHMDNHSDILDQMVADNPIINYRTKDMRPRPYEFLCSGQSILCKSLRVTIAEWDAKDFDADKFFIEDIGYRPTNIVIGKRRGIPEDKDGNLPLRFVDENFIKYITK